MTELVIDSGVAVKWFVDETHSAEALRILAAYRASALSFLAPDFIYAEFGNIMWKKQAFRGFDPSDAEFIVGEFRAQITFSLTSTGELLEEAYRLAVTHQRTVYDMLYLALSLRAGCQFVTADEKLVNAIGAAFPNVVWLANWP
ncbi:MAG: type II toxin-antitoxin system VapC family toxin [Acidobacteria bacterium]|nr:type II toxin-antitoxin system VapC family toxin [Acidobacteriota bacterium]